MGAAAWILGGAVLAVGGLVVFEVVANAKPKLTATNKLEPGKRYQFVALRGTNDVGQVKAGLQALGWSNVNVWFYGDASAPASITWPPVADMRSIYAAQATWGGASIDIPGGLIGLQKIG